MANQKQNGIVAHSNKVMGLVYVGAAILIIVVGFRGLSTKAADVLPSFMLGPEGAVSLNLVVFALVLEFALLLLLSLVTFKTPHEENGKKEVVHPASNGFDIQLFRSEMDKIKEITREEKTMISSYLDDFEKMSDRIINIQEKNVKALKTMREELSR